jgi:hypothetical protein
MNGIGISVDELTSVPHAGSARLLLENRDDGGANMRWVVKWHNFQLFSGFRNLISIVRGYRNLLAMDNILRNITRIASKHPNLSLKNNILSMSYRRQIDGDQTILCFLSMVFQSSEETEICFGALQALCQIDKLLRENADTGLLEDGPNLSDPDPAIPNTSHK